MNPRALFVVPIVALLSLGACSASGAGTSVASDGGPEVTADAIVDSSSDGVGERDADTGSSTETCPPNANPTGCPGHYFEIPKGAACSPAGLSCRYYGEGDLPCPSYAICTCEVPTGADGGAAVWTHCLQ